MVTTLYLHSLSAPMKSTTSPGTSLNCSASTWGKYSTWVDWLVYPSLAKLGSRPSHTMCLMVSTADEFLCTIWFVYCSLLQFATNQTCFLICLSCHSHLPTFLFLNLRIFQTLTACAYICRWEPLCPVRSSHWSQWILASGQVQSQGAGTRRCSLRSCLRRTRPLHGVQTHTSTWREVCGLSNGLHYQRGEQEVRPHHRQQQGWSRLASSTASVWNVQHHQGEPPFIQNGHLYSNLTMSQEINNCCCWFNLLDISLSYHLFQLSFSFCLTYYNVRNSSMTSYPLILDTTRVKSKSPTWSCWEEYRLICPHPWLTSSCP